MFHMHSRLDLRKLASTRFGYNVLVLERLLKCREPLGRMATSMDFIAWDQSQGPDGVAFIATVFATDFWRDVEQLVTALRPMYAVLRLVDREGSTMGLLYEFMEASARLCNDHFFHMPGMYVTSIQHYIQAFSFHCMTSWLLVIVYGLLLARFLLVGWRSSNPYAYGDGISSIDPFTQWLTYYTHCGSHLASCRTRSY
ncbi:hypothetical protein O6H91_13G008500 [Diphasiastrum complanatum]|uniref:Uncharacterized protein n=1 Tax=Diphasiastrum complanatum TaxID=34168 RepID=A0ACC2BS03_DIPCM|nr:hypothetical protein O6H91_13G008500 [Diphasiastrum complanatum]